LPQVTAADLQFPNEEGEISLTDDDDDDPNDEDYTDDTAKKLASTLNQEHKITALLGLTDMASAMATQEEQILEEEDNDGAMNYQVNETEGVDNIDELQQHLLNQVANVDHKIRMLQEASDINTATNSNTE
jgi:ABC-type Zn2+ transport system substrate-binding protein/surface adhesin